MLSPQRHWCSPHTGMDYAVTWLMQIGEREFEPNPLLDDQDYGAIE